MLKLLQIEFMKMRRKKLMWLMMLAALVMPFFALMYFHYFGKIDIAPAEFYRWSAFGYTLFIILPFVLGMLCTMLMHDENRYDMLKQLWIVPVSRLGYFFSKFFVVLIYSICFMLITAVASVLLSVLPGYVIFDLESVFFLLKTCLEVALFSTLAMLPILAIAASQKSYLLPVCITLIYVFAGFFMTPINMYLHPISSTLVIISRNGGIPGLTFPHPANVMSAISCICVWGIVAVLLANSTLCKRK